MAVATCSYLINTSYTRVTLTGTGGDTSSLHELYQTVHGQYPEVMSYTQSTQTYHLHLVSGSYAYLAMNAGTVLLIPTGSTFIHDGIASATAGTPVFYTYGGSKLICGSGSTIQFSSGGGYVYFYGQVEAIGTAQHPITMSNFRTINVYGTYITDQKIFQFVNFKNCTYYAGCFLYFSQYNQPSAPQMIFNNITMSNDSSNRYGYGLYFLAGGMYQNVKIDGVFCSGVYRGALINGSSVKLKNGKFTDIDYPQVIACLGGGNVVSATYQTTKNDNTFPTGRFQSMVVLENLTFDDLDSTSDYAITAYYNSLAYVKGCTFSATGGTPAYRGIYTSNGSVVIENDNDWTDLLSNSSRKVQNAEGTILHGHEFEFVVLDEEESPVNQAMVSIIQKSTPSKQRWVGLTNQDGKLFNVFGDNPVLIEKEEYSLDNSQSWAVQTVINGDVQLYQATSGYNGDYHWMGFSATLDYSGSLKLYCFSTGSGFNSSGTVSLGKANTDGSNYETISTVIKNAEDQYVILENVELEAGSYYFIGHTDGYWRDTTYNYRPIITPAITIDKSSYNLADMLTGTSHASGTYGFGKIEFLTQFEQDEMGHTLVVGKQGYAIYSQDIIFTQSYTGSNAITVSLSLPHEGGTSSQGTNPGIQIGQGIAF